MKVLVTPGAPSCSSIHTRPRCWRSPVRHARAAGSGSGWRTHGPRPRFKLQRIVPAAKRTS